MLICLTYLLVVQIWITDGLAVANYIIDSRTTTAAGNRNIIFITAFPEHIYTAVNDIHCTAYLLKPYTQKDLYAQLDAIFHTEYALQLKTLEGIYAKLNFAEIYYIESHARYMYFHTTQGIIKSRQYRLKELTTLLPSFFIQCHKSYIINSKYIDFVSPGQHFHISLKQSMNRFLTETVITPLRRNRSDNLFYESHRRT